VSAEPTSAAWATNAGRTFRTAGATVPAGAAKGGVDTVQL